MITHYIISDLHLANGGRRDDFKKNRTKFKSFLQKVKKEKAHLIISGDSNSLTIPSGSPGQKSSSSTAISLTGSTILKN